jgi:predicted SAM-dependent methyltransferase
MGSLIRLAKAPIRKAIQARQLRQRVREANQLRLIIGASGTVQSGWIPTEQNLVDLLEPSTWSRFFEDSSIDGIMAEHVWEHLTPEQGRIAARTCFQFLRPGGYLRVAVPDGNHPSPDYIERVRPGGSGVGADDHKVLYEYRSFSETFGQAGFDIQLIEYFDEHGRFQNVDWDLSKGLVRRTLLFDERNRQESYGYTSLFLDAIKPELGVTSAADSAQAA